MRWPTFEQFVEAKSPSRTIAALAWIAAAGVVVALAFLRTQTEAEYGFASAALVPIIAVTWLTGRRGGLLLTALAMLAWTAADITFERQFSNEWVPYIDGITRFLTYSFVTLVVARLHMSLLRERRLSSYDALTGVLNRRVFIETGEFEVDRARRYRHSLAVAFLDLDNFKHVNDSNGHHVGDAALCAVAAALRGSLRSTDRVGRVGGDEFAILFPEIGRSEAGEAAAKLADALRKGLADYPPVSASIGVAWFEQADRPFSDMLRSADEIMYAIKKDGKDGVRMKPIYAAAGRR
jgi:diguanylate cyclase (GGDEF)-like protein